MADALIGYTGFVGQNLLEQHRFDDLYNSKNIEQIAGKSFDLLVVSGAPAQKWIANREPENDLKNIQRLIAAVTSCKARRVVVISTVDVYPDPRNVDEATVIDTSKQQPYGKHRYLLEQAIAAHFSDVLVVRLPGLFGPHLKKNAIYDLLNNNEVHKIHSDGIFQFYDLRWLWRDIQKALTANLRVLNLATEPVSVAEVAKRGLGIDFINRPPEVKTPATYDFRSKHAAAFGGAGGYLYSKEQVLEALRDFAAHFRAAALPGAGAK